MTPKIRVIYQDEPFSFEPWTAYDEDSLDRAPALGSGETKEEAIQDLLRQLTEEDEPCSPTAA
jgi:hypothetical protein